MTFRTTAGFARLPFWAAFTALCAAALASTFAVLWFVHAAWMPSLRQAVEALPNSGEIRHGQLDWIAPSPLQLSEGRFLSVVVDLEGKRERGQVSDLQLELRRKDWRLYSLFGFVELPYSVNWRTALNREDVQAWWGAWKPFLICGGVVALFLGFFTVWVGLATVYAGPVWMTAYFMDRDLTLSGSWKLCSACLIPAVGLICVAIVLYAWHQLSLTILLIAVPLHFVAGLTYIAMSLRQLPLVDKALPLGSNPFLIPAPRITGN